jgi:hypothetical protein
MAHNAHGLIKAVDFSFTRMLIATSKIFNKKKKEYLNLETQNKLVDLFNNYLQEHRDKYKSLFLPSYREGKRKRISFGLVFQIVEFILDQYF